MDVRKPMDGQAVLLMLMCCSIWAVQQIGLKITAADAPPVLQIGLRSGIAAACVLVLIAIRRERISLARNLLVAGVGAGLVFSIEFVLVGESIKFTSASHVVVFLYTAPIFAALGLHWLLPSERLAPMQWAGIAIASAGIAIAFLGHETSESQDLPQMLLGDIFALLGGACWGLSTVIIRGTALSRAPGAHTLFYQLATGFVCMTAAAILMGQGYIIPGPAVFANIAFQGFIVSFFSYLVWFQLLTRYKAGQLGVFSFLTPILGVVAGIVLLGEPLTREFVIGAVCVLAGIITVSAYPWLRKDRRNTA